MGFRIQRAVFMGLTRDPGQILFSLLFTYPVLVAIPVEHGGKHPREGHPLCKAGVTPFRYKIDQHPGTHIPHLFNPENQRRVTLSTGNSHHRVTKRIHPGAAGRRNPADGNIENTQMIGQKYAAVSFDPIRGQLTAQPGSLYIPGFNPRIIKGLIGCIDSKISVSLIKMFSKPGTPDTNDGDFIRKIHGYLQLRTGVHFQK